MPLTLATRLSGFLLATLAIVLAGFSLLLHGLASNHLYHRASERLSAARGLIAAAVEIRPEYVQWEAYEREIAVGREVGDERILWTVEDDKGQSIDRSANLAHELATARWLSTIVDKYSIQTVTDSRGEIWQVSGLEVRAPKPNKARNRPAWLSIVVATPLGPVQKLVHALDLQLLVADLGLIVIAAFLARWWARRAISPLIYMAESARDLDAAHPGWNVVSTGNGDELDRLGTSLNELLGRLHLAYERQRRFAGDASHQLRTPLTAMMGQLEVALRRERSPDEYRRVLSTARSQAEHLAKIVEALLFLGSADADARLPEMQRFELGDWLQTHIHDSRHHDSVVITHTERAYVLAQPALLGSLVDNLLDNAFEYGKSNRPTEVSIILEGTDRVLLRVEDFGAGIAAEDLPHLFEPFFRSSESRRLGRPGTGLGLAVVERVTRVFGGTVSAESPGGKGAIFTVKLPRLAAVAANSLESIAPIPEPIQ